MEPEEFAAHIAKLWIGLCDHLYAFATVIVHWLIVLGDVAWKIIGVLYTIGAVCVRRGWRIVLPWIFIYMCAGISYRIANGLPLPDVAAIAGATIPMAGTVVVALITRSIETRSGVGNNSVIMNTIGSMFTNITNTFAPGMSIDGAPRPVAPA